MRSSKPTPKAQSEAPSVDELDLLVATMMHWQGFYDEAMQNLPEETRQFVETTSWASELHQIEREKIAKAKINRLIAQAEVKGMKKINDRFVGLYGIGGDGNDHVATYRKVYFDNAQEIQALSNNLSKEDGK